MYRFAVKRNFRLFVLGLGGFNHHLQDVSHTATCPDEGTIEMEKMRRKVEQQVANTCKNWMNKEKVPGMSLAITYNGRLMMKQGFGYKDKELGIPADADMTAEVASIAKPITAHLLMKLHDDATISNFDIHSDIRQFIPELDKDLRVNSNNQSSKRPCFTYSQDKPFDVSMLLCHRSGIRHYDCRMKEEEAQAMQEQYETTTRALELFINDPLETWPGEDNYTSYGYNLAGAVLEAITDQRFHDYAADELARYNMRNSTYHQMTHPRFNTTKSYCARYHNYDNFDKYEHGETVDLSFKYPSGGLVSTVGDLVKFADTYSALFQELLRFEERPLNSDTLRLMWSRHMKKVKSNRNNRSDKLSYGLGWWISSIKRERPGRRKPKIDYVTTFFHDGKGSGTSAYLGTTVISCENLATISRMGRNLPPTPADLVQNCSFQCTVETKDDLAQSSNIISASFKGFTIAIIANMPYVNTTQLADSIKDILLQNGFGCS